MLEELKTRKRKSSTKKRSRSPSGRKNNTIEAPPSMMNHSRRSNNDLFNIF